MALHHRNMFIAVYSNPTLFLMVSITEAYFLGHIGSEASLFLQATEKLIAVTTHLLITLGQACTVDLTQLAYGAPPFSMTHQEVFFRNLVAVCEVQLLMIYLPVQAECFP